MALALIGNFLSIMAIRKKISKSSAAIYMLNLAIFDMLPIWVKGAYILFGKYGIAVGTVACKGLFFIMNLSIQMAMWLVVVITGERFIAVTFPLKLSLWCTPKHAKIVVALLFMLFCAIDAQYLFMVDFIKSDLGTGRCTTLPEYKKYINNATAAGYASSKFLSRER